MNAFTFRSALLSVFLACAAHATDHVVLVSDGYVDNFVPKNVVVDVGDTVTFKAFGNLEAHNVHADDDSFRCSVGCRGDGSGATGDPSKNAWNATLTFATPGVVHYHCDPHPVYGTGTITVNAAASGPAIGPGFSGNWYDPSPNQNGHGIQLEILKDNGVLAIWFVFDPTGSAQNWIYAQGSYDPASNAVTIPAFLEQGGRFPPNFDSRTLSASAWGSLTLRFSDCNSGQAEWKSNAASAAAGYADTTFPISRVTSIAGTTCP